MGRIAVQLQLACRTTSTHCTLSATMDQGESELHSISFLHRKYINCGKAYGESLILSGPEQAVSELDSSGHKFCVVMVIFDGPEALSYGLKFLREHAPRLPYNTLCTLTTACYVHCINPHSICMLPHFFPPLRILCPEITFEAILGWPQFQLLQLHNKSYTYVKVTSHIHNLTSFYT